MKIEFGKKDKLTFLKNYDIILYRKEKRKGYDVMKHYLDIKYMKEKYSDCMTVGNEIVVEEKVDGAQASFTFSPSENCIEAFSRKTQLNEMNNLRGFYEWTQRLDVQAIGRITHFGRYIIFGEYLCSHTVSYPQDKYNKFYMYDVWDTVTEKWLGFKQVKALYEQLAKAVSRTNEVIEFVPVFFEGAFNSWEHLLSYVGRTELGASPCGEGIVVKNQTTLNDENSRLPFYIKIVSEKFSEVHEVKPKKNVSPEKLKEKEEEKQLVMSIVTKRRVIKLLEKMVDNGVLRERWDEKDMGLIAKNIGKLVYEDCVKEEPGVVSQCKNFGKTANSIAMTIVREELKTRWKFLSVF